jgi:hypothetical protein
MSTDQQEFSPNQEAAIKQYTASDRFEVVRTYRGPARVLDARKEFVKLGGGEGESQAACVNTERVLVFHARLNLWKME